MSDLIESLLNQEIALVDDEGNLYGKSLVSEVLWPMSFDLLEVNGQVCLVDTDDDNEVKGVLGTSFKAILVQLNNFETYFKEDPIVDFERFL